MFRKQNARQPAAAVLLALLLALTSAFSCIGLSGWVSFRQQTAALDAQYTTIAYPTNNRRDETRPATIREDGAYLYEDGSVWLTPAQVSSFAEQAPGLLRRDAHILTAAHTPGLKGFSSGAADPMDYNATYDMHRYSLSVMAARCMSASGPATFIMEWIEPVCRMAAYDLPEAGREFTLSVDLGEGNTAPPLVPGKNYLLQGDFDDFEVMEQMRPVKSEGGSEHAEIQRFRYTGDYVAEIAAPGAEMPQQRLWLFCSSLPHKDSGDIPAVLADVDIAGHPYPAVPHFYLNRFADMEQDGGMWHISVPEGSWPFYAEYEGDWRDFLNTEEGRVWRDEIIPCCEANHDSVAVLLTENIQELSQFCLEQSALLEGRTITPEEYKTGAAVCLVGADYALYNGLSVGDTLTLDLYKPAYATQAGTLQSVTPQYFTYTGCMPLVPENRLDVTRDYTIVGLYSTPARPMDEDGHGFRGDTVLAPKASAPEVVAAAEEDTVTPLLNTLVLKNGSIDEFEAYMAENGAAERFRYYDYGYSAMAESLQAMEKNASRLALLGGAAFLLGAAVFLLAGFARMAPAARGLRLLGANAGYVMREMLAALLPLAAAGAGVGALLGGALYGKVCEVVLSESLAVSWPILLGCAALELAVLCAVACVWATLTACRSLMRRKDE